MITKAKIGDTVSALGYSFKIGEIIYQDLFCGDWDIEFLDVEGNYHHWKSAFDGGTITRGE